MINFLGEKCGIQKFSKSDGHFYRKRPAKFPDQLVAYECVDHQIDFNGHTEKCRNYVEPVKRGTEVCTSVYGGDKRHKSHDCPSRRDVELSVFRWAVRLQAYKDKTGTPLSVTTKVYLDWPFEIDLTPPRLAHAFNGAIKTALRYGAALPDTDDHQKREIIEQLCGRVQLRAFIKHLKGTTEYWGAPKLRE